MNIKPLNKNYKVTIEFDITLDQVRDYVDMPSEEFEELVQPYLDDQDFIGDAATHIADEVMGHHEEEEAVYFDVLDFTVNSYKIKTIEE